MPKITALCSWSLSPTDPDHLIRMTQECGLSSIQLALLPLTNNQWDLNQLTTKLADAKIKICSTMMTTIDEDYSSLESIKATGGLRPSQHWTANQQRAVDSARIAQQLNLTLITLHAGFIPEHECAERDTMIHRIATIASIFADSGVNLALETGQEHASTLLELLNHPALSNVKVNFDPANMILYNMGDPIQSLALLKPHIAQIHIKDAIPTQTQGQWGTEVPVGSGAVDWTPFFRIVSTLPDTINLVIERESGTQRIQDIIVARKLIQNHLHP